MREWWRTILENQKGAAMPEYALLLTLIAAALVTVVYALGQEVLALYVSFTNNFP